MGFWGARSWRRDLRGVIVGLNKPEQDLKRDLQGVASDLKWSAVELLRVAERLSQAGNEADAQAVQDVRCIPRR